MKMLYAAILGAITSLGLITENASSDQSPSTPLKGHREIKDQLAHRTSLDFVQNNPDGRDHSFKE